MKANIKQSLLQIEKTLNDLPLNRKFRVSTLIWILLPALIDASSFVLKCDMEMYSSIAKSVLMAPVFLFLVIWIPIKIMIWMIKVFALFPIDKSLSKMSSVASRAKDLITYRPISFLLSIARFLPKKYRVCLEQEISDMRIEYYEARKMGHMWQARFIIANFYIALSRMVVQWGIDRVKKFVGFVVKT